MVPLLWWMMSEEDCCWPLEESSRCSRDTVVGTVPQLRQCCDCGSNSVHQWCHCGPNSECKYQIQSSTLCRLLMQKPLWCVALTVETRWRIPQSRYILSVMFTKTSSQRHLNSKNSCSTSKCKHRPLLTFPLFPCHFWIFSQSQSIQYHVFLTCLSSAQMNRQIRNRYPTPSKTYCLPFFFSPPSLFPLFSPLLLAVSPLKIRGGCMEGVIFWDFSSHQAPYVFLA